ncbi:putative surface-exposed virulence protein BigA [Colletotrichum shisoi]|uniref:Putative surface-exposed virulence protein BigA n=1 Tax=Colletotrichum shisoi TaxID=2078593 RepID=A0A5Q4BQP1_9PEZI|nr:putative surface-exposed virulence protein BigA [Colletotrichum shisoi]
MARMKYSAHHRILVDQHIVREGLVPASAGYNIHLLLDKIGAKGKKHALYTHGRIQELVKRRTYELARHPYAPQIIEEKSSNGDTDEDQSWRYPDWMQKWLEPGWVGDDSPPDDTENNSPPDASNNTAPAGNDSDDGPPPQDHDRAAPPGGGGGGGDGDGNNQGLPCDDDRHEVGGDVLNNMGSGLRNHPSLWGRDTVNTPRPTSNPRRHERNRIHHNTQRTLPPTPASLRDRLIWQSPEARQSPAGWDVGLGISMDSPVPSRVDDIHLLTPAASTSGRRARAVGRQGDALTALFHRLVTQRTEALQLWLQSVHLRALQTRDLGPTRAGRRRLHDQQQQQQQREEICRRFNVVRQQLSQTEGEVMKEEATADVSRRDPRTECIGRIFSLFLQRDLVR